MKKANATPEEMALALAWVHKEVTLTQVDRALGRTSSGSGAYSYLARCLKQYIIDQEHAWMKGARR